MHAADIVGYTFQSDTYCPGCIVAVMTPQGSNTVSTWNADQTLTALALAANIDRMDEHSFDSDEFPKVIFGDMVHSGDEPDYCGRCHELLAPYECSICGDEHGESRHGDPLVQRDTGRDTITGLVETFHQDALNVLSGTDRDYTVGSPAFRLLELRREWESATDDERDEFAPEYLDDIDTILHDAGFHAITDADQGTWAVYAPVLGKVAS